MKKYEMIGISKELKNRFNKHLYMRTVETQKKVKASDLFEELLDTYENKVELPGNKTRQI